MSPHAHIRSLPPEGEQGLPWGGPAGGLTMSLHAHICSLPPEGEQGLPWGGPAGGLTPTTGGLAWR